jgi:hypothetical protein
MVCTRGVYVNRRGMVAQATTVVRIDTVKHSPDFVRGFGHRTNALPTTAPTRSS